MPHDGDNCERRGRQDRLLRAECTKYMMATLANMVDEASSRMRTFFSWKNSNPISTARMHQRCG
jgi:hypothetical protein